MTIERDVQILADDNAMAHDALNQCVEAIGSRIKGIEEYVQNLPTPDKILYKPKGVEDYLSLKENLDLIYDKLTALEEKVNG
jgi:hypothetical protein|tara:strand:+ start:442 stop:687 length:246 start_codon:yes stop_codon:yes gene_type:complete